MGAKKSDTVMVAQVGVLVTLNTKSKGLDMEEA
jgi:hypothetical protein